MLDARFDLAGIRVKQERPLQSLSLAALGLLPLGRGLAATAVLATGLVLLAFPSQVCGLVLDSVGHGRKETKRLAWLAHKAPAR